MRSAALALAPLLAVACAAPARTPVRDARLDALAPGQVARAASLFGTDVVGLPTGAFMTPDAAPGSRILPLDPHAAEAPWLRAGGAGSVALSPDGRTLLVMTAGFNRAYDARGEALASASTEWIFVYDVSSGVPVETQVVPIPDALEGLAFEPSGARFWASGGGGDAVHAFARDGAGRFVREASVTLGHLDPRGGGGLGLGVGPFAAGLALVGTTLIVANHENDSVSFVDTASREVTGELSLRPGASHPGGEFPYGVLAVGTHVWVSSMRDRELVEVDVPASRVVRRVKVGGMPVKLVANRSGTRVYVANANDDSVSVVDTTRGEVVSTIATVAPPADARVVGRLRGSNPNALALSPDGGTLWVTNGGNSDVAMISLAPRDRGDTGAGPARSEVVGLVPTGFYPMAVATARDGGSVFVAYAKSPSGPNPLGPWNDVAIATTRPYARIGNEFALQLQHAGLHAFPVPDAGTLRRLTAQSRINNRFDADPSHVPGVLAKLRSKVKHVVYVVGENRTYDQIFGDLAGTDADPRLVHWGEAITPNHHALARGFVALDRFFDAGGVSGEGWQWSTAGRTTDAAERTIPLEYAGRGRHGYDWEGTNRGVNVSLPTLAERKAWSPRTPDDPDLLPGRADAAAVDGPDEGGTGFLWDAARAAGLEVRSYGFFVDDARYNPSEQDPSLLPPSLREPWKTGTRVAFPARASLHDATDPFFRGYDQSFPDYWRVQEWSRELDGFVARGSLPALSLVRISHDHLGAFARAVDGVDTPDTQMADHDYAVGLIVEKLSRTPFWKDTVVIVIEDDAQNGSDHVDAHRSFALLAGAHVRRGAIVSTPWTTPSVLRTIELLLGLPPLGQQDAFAPSMAELFQEEEDATPFTAIVPAVLRSTRLPLPPARPGESAAAPRGTAALWAERTRGFDLDRVDAAPADALSRLLYCTLAAGARCAAE